MSVPTPEQDRAIIRSALDAIEKWDEIAMRNTIGAYPVEWRELESAIKSLRLAITDAGYLEADGGDR